MEKDEKRRLIKEYLALLGLDNDSDDAVFLREQCYRFSMFNLRIMIKYLTKALGSQPALLVLCKASVYCNTAKAGQCTDCPIYDRCATEHGLIEITKAAIATTE